MKVNNNNTNEISYRSSDVQSQLSSNVFNSNNSKNKNTLNRNSLRNNQISKQSLTRLTEKEEQQHDIQLSTFSNNNILKNQLIKNSEIHKNEGRAIIALTAPNKTRDKKKNDFTKKEIELLTSEIHEIKDKLFFQSELKNKTKQIILLQEKIKVKENIIKELKQNNKTLKDFYKSEFMNNNKNNEENDNNNNTTNNFFPQIKDNNTNNNSVNNTNSKNATTSNSLFKQIIKEENTLENFRPLILDLQRLIGEMYISTESTELIKLGNKLLKNLTEIDFKLTNDKTNKNTIKEKERIISLMKGEIQETKAKENMLLRDKDDLLISISVLEKEIRGFKEQISEYKNGNRIRNSGYNNSRLGGSQSKSKSPFKKISTVSLSNHNDRFAKPNSGAFIQSSYNNNNLNILDTLKQPGIINKTKTNNDYLSNNNNNNFNTNDSQIKLNKSHSKTYYNLTNMNFNSYLSSKPLASESVLAKENADLRRRLEKSCLFLLKKKEKILKLTEKLESSQKKIESLNNARFFYDNEDLKIIENLNKKIKLTYSGFKPEYAKRTLDFRIDMLKEKYKELLKEIIENGTEEFIKHFFLMNKNEQEHLISFISDQMLSNIDYSKRLNKLNLYFSQILKCDKDDTVKQIRACFNEVFECERVVLWIFNEFTNEYYTISNFNKLTENYNHDHFITVINEGIYNRSVIANKQDTKLLNHNKHNDHNVVDISNNKTNVNNVSSLHKNNSKLVLMSQNNSNKEINDNNTKEAKGLIRNEQENRLSLEKNPNINEENVVHRNKEAHFQSNANKEVKDLLSTSQNLTTSIDNKNTQYFNIYDDETLTNLNCNEIKSILSMPIINAQGKVLGIIETINSTNGLFGFDEEYLLFSICYYLSFILERNNQVETETKLGKVVQVNSTIINIMKSKSYYELQLAVEEETKKLMKAIRTRIIYTNGKEFYTFSSDENKNTFITGGIAHCCLRYHNGVVCKFPNEDELYNPNIDIEIENQLGFYSIPLRYQDSIFAIIQFSLPQSELIQYKGDKNRQISKLDDLREKMMSVIIEAINGCLEGLGINIINN